MELLGYALSELDRHGDATAVFERLVSTGDAPRLRVALAEQLTGDAKPKKALAIYAGALQSCAPLVADGLRLRCLLGHADAIAATDPSAATQAYQRVIDAFHERGLAAGSPESSWPAQAAFNIAGPALARLESGKRAPIDKQQAVVRTLDAQYRSVASLAHAEWTVAAGFQRGHAHAVLAERLGAEIRKRPSRKGALAEAQTTAAEEAVRAYRSARREAEKNHIENEWSRKVEAALRDSP